MNVIADSERLFLEIFLPNKSFWEKAIEFFNHDEFKDLDKTNDFSLDNRDDLISFIKETNE